MKSQLWTTRIVDTSSQHLLRLEGEAAEPLRLEGEAAEPLRLEGEAAETLRLEGGTAETLRLEGGTTGASGRIARDWQCPPTTSTHPRRPI